MVAPALTPPLSIGAKVAAYVALTKPRIIELLLVTTVPTMVVAERGMPPLWLMVATVLGGALAAGGANAINMYVDRDIDALMERTKDRPLVTGAVTPAAALVFAVVASRSLAFVWLWAVVNLLSAVLGLSACLFYVFVYTLWLKRTSSQNIVIGGAAGADPGADRLVLGDRHGVAFVGAVVLFALMFFWTPPHFWALAIKYKDDYSAADVPMLPVGGQLPHHDHARCWRTPSWSSPCRSLFGWTAELVGSCTGSPPWSWGRCSSGCRWTSCAPSHPRRAIKLFTFSITYVTLLFGVMAADVLVRHGLVT